MITIKFVFNWHVSIFPDKEIKCYFFIYLVKYWNKEYNMASVAHLSTNQIVDIL